MPQASPATRTTPEFSAVLAGRLACWEEKLAQQRVFERSWIDDPGETSVFDGCHVIVGHDKERVQLTFRRPCKVAHLPVELAAENLVEDADRHSFECATSEPRLLVPPK